jgi:phospholipid-binding lipoprotein MlaA
MYIFNEHFDAAFLKPPAKIYKALVPDAIKTSINHFYENINMIPTVGNDLLQGEGKAAIKGTWRFLINSTLGLGGLFDVATSFQLPPHSNDLGITFAKWGDTHSPYLVLPFLGPTTIRDAFGSMFEYALMTPYPYLKNDSLLYSLLAVRYVDLRSQILQTDPLLQESFDKYTFLRDAWLANRNFRIQGEQALPEGKEENLGQDYVE